MVATGRSAVLRRAGSFLSLLAFEVAAVAILTRLGSIPELRIPWHNLTPWLLDSPVEDVLVAILRSIALLIAWWLLGSNLLYLLASLTRVPSAIRAVRWLTLPLVRRATDHALALTLATSLMSAGTGTGVAGAATVGVMAPQRPGPVAAEHHRDAAAAGPLAYAPNPAGPRREDASVHPVSLPGYLPQPAGIRAQQTETTSGQPGYVPKPAGKPPGAQPQPTSTSSGPTSTTERSPASTTAPPSTRPPTSTVPSDGTRPTSTSPPSTTEPTSTSPPSTTRPTSTSPPSTTEPTSTSPPSTAESPASTAPSTTAPPPSAGTRPSTTGYVPRPAGTPSTTGPSRTTTPPRSTAPPRTSAPGATPPTTAPPGGGQQPAPSPQPPGGQPARSHRVLQGDNLWTISRDHLAAATNRRASDLSDHEIASYWLRVIAVNRSSLRSGNPDLIFPGELIMFPPVNG